MKTLFKFAAALAAIAIIFSCTKEKGEDGGKNDGGTSLNQDIEFTLSVSETDATSAKIRVTHNGEREDTWYWFVTTENDINKAISAKVEDLKKEGNITLQKSTGKNITVKDLEAKTTYTFVVFGLSSEGEVYGTPADIEFTTKADLTDLTESDEWTITYRRGEFQGEKAELFHIECADDLTYYFTYIDKYSLDYYEITPLDYAISAIEYELPVLLERGYTYEDLLITGTEDIAYPRMEWGEYYAFAIGLTSDGEITGTYSIAEYEVVEEEATPEYNQWLGTYKLTSAPYSYEYEGETYNVQNSFTITIEHYDNNFKYAMSGWECGDNQDLDFTTALGSTIYMPLSFQNGAVGFEETFLTYLSASEESTDDELAFGLWGICDIVYGGETYNEQIFALEGATMGLAKTTDNGLTGSIEGQSISYEGYDITYIGMGYLGIPVVEGIYLQMYNDYMKFPITMEKVADAPVQQSLASPVRIPTNPKHTAIKRCKKPIIEFKK